MSALTITYVGGPTALLEVAGLRLLTDPTFDPAGRKYNFGWGTSSRKLQDPALTAAELAPIDAVLLSHDHHDDNLDDAGREMLPSAGSGDHHPRRQQAARRQLARPRPLELDHAASARRHRGPDHRDPLPPRPAAEPADRRRGVGFLLEWEGQRDGAVWITGDTVWFSGISEVGRALRRRHRDRPPRRRRASRSPARPATR